ncbi:MAG: type II toxin-antitoxin system RelE/ParE family toxin [Acidobacteriota bacterium]|nr:type II toxin-antitoxin system RelE/ParE family toxin [Acidobacteriota bacterium]
MGAYRLTRRAAADLDAIFEYTALRFGLEQAQRYFNELHECCQRLAGNLGLGRSAESLAPGLRRYEFRSHVVFYTGESRELVIVRVLHARMDALRHVRGKAIRVPRASDPN